MGINKVLNIRIIAGSFFVVVLVLVMVMTSRWLVADLEIIRVQNAIDSWSENSTATSLISWEEEISSIEKVKSLKSNESLSHVFHGILFEWRGFAIEGEEITAEDIISSRRETVNNYREAVMLQPALAENWSRLARAKVYGGEMDGEYGLALEQAILLGKNIPRVQQEVVLAASLGSSYWMDDSALSDTITNFIAVSLQGSGNVGEMLSYLEGTSLLPAVCSLLDLENVGAGVRQACMD